MKKVWTIIITFLLFVIGSVSASALSWNGSSTGGDGGGSAATTKGFAVRYTSDNCIGYRFSAVNKSGANKTATVIDVFRNTTYGNKQYSNGYKFSTKYNKKQLIGVQNGNFSTESTTSNCYKEADMAFATALPTPDGIKTWQANNTNLNKVLGKLGLGTISNLVNGDKILVEPIYDVRLEAVYHAVTPTEIALYGKHLLGASSNGGSSSNSDTWGFISNYTNKHYPNSLYTTDGKGLWTNATALTGRATFSTIINSGYGVGIAYNETKPEFSPALSVTKCTVWDGTAASHNSTAWGTTTGNAFSNYSYISGYPQYGKQVSATVQFDTETQNTYVKQTVSVDGTVVGTRKVWSNNSGSQNYLIDVSGGNPISKDKSGYTIKAQSEWIDSNGKVLKTGTAKTFYIPVQPTYYNESVVVRDVTGTITARAASPVSSGAVYAGQRIYLQYQYSSDNTWTSATNIRATAQRYNGSSWQNITTDAAYDASYDNVSIKAASPVFKSGRSGLYTVPAKSGTGGNNDRLRFLLTNCWASDSAHTTDSSTQYLTVCDTDIALTDIRLCNRKGDTVDPNKLVVGEDVMVNYEYTNNTATTVHVIGYDHLFRPIGTFSIPAQSSIQVSGSIFTMPESGSDISVWGGVYLDGVAIFNTNYETNHNNNAITLPVFAEKQISVEIIEPNAPYRKGTDVITSCWVINEHAQDVLPSDNTSLTFFAVRGSEMIHSTYIPNVVVPAKGKNLYYLRWTVPDDDNGDTVQIYAQLSVNGEYPTTYSRTFPIFEYNHSTVPDSQFEHDKATFSLSAYPNISTCSYASWVQWKYTGSELVPVTYGLRCYPSTMSISPASTAHSANSTDIRSGYAITVTGRMNTSFANVTPPLSDAYTLAQTVTVLLPEYEYSTANGSCITAEFDGNAWQLPDTYGYGHVHHIPINYPDGNYNVFIYFTDIWTPAGMLSLLPISNSLTVNGSAYDDWYHASY